MSIAASYSIAAIFSAKDKLSPVVNQIEKKYGSFAGNVGRGLNTMNQGFNKLGKVVATAGLALAGGFAAGAMVATKEFINLDNAVTQAGAKFVDLDVKSKTYSQSLAALKAKSREVASVTEFMATDAAGALDKMAMAGMKSDVSMALLMGTTNLATSSGTDLTTAVDIVTDSMGAFGLSMNNAADAEKNLTRLSDVMAKTTTTANTDLSMMFESIKAGGSTFTSAGQSLETFSAMVGVLANSGIKGAESGTSLRNVMLRLAAPTGEAATLLKTLGVRTKDAQGNFRDVIDIIADFEKGLNGMGTAQKSAALATIFGARTVTGINLLLAEGSQKLRDYRTQLENSAGASTEMAGAMRQSIGNQIEILKSSLMELGLKFVESFEKDGRGALHGLIDKVQNFDMKPITDGVRDAIDVLKTINGIVMSLGGWKFIAEIIITMAIAVKVLSAAMFIMNLASAPINLTFLAIFAAITALGIGIALLIKNWDKVISVFKSAGDYFMNTFVPILQNVGQTILKALLTPVNLIISGIVSLLNVASNIPGIGGKFKSAAESVAGFQDKMNTAMTGTAGTFDYGGIWNNQPDQPATQEQRQQDRLKYAPNSATENTTRILQTQRGEGTIKVMSENGTPLKVDQGTMNRTGWNMEALGRDGA